MSILLVASFLAAGLALHAILDTHNACRTPTNGEDKKLQEWETRLVRINRLIKADKKEEST